MWEHEISFQPWNSLKGQVLAHFLAELDDTSDPQAADDIGPSWTLFTDGRSNEKGSGAGFILTDPDKKEYTYALNFKFPTTNNEAEYEALLAGLRIARKIGVQNIKVFVDSLLVANQVKGIFEAIQDSM